MSVGGKHVLLAANLVARTGQSVIAGTVLHFGAADPTEPELSFFAAEVAKQSNHRLRVDVDRVTYFSETLGGEERLVPDLRRGRVDFAYIPSRDWAATGDAGFRLDAAVSPGLDRRSRADGRRAA